MKTILTILFSLSAIALLAQRDLSFEEYNPVSTLVVPGDSILSAKYPFIDIHSHQFNMANQDLSALINDMDALNEAIMINLSGAPEPDSKRKSTM